MSLLPSRERRWRGWTYSSNLGVQINNKLSWSHNTDALFRKGQSRLFFLRRLKSFSVCNSVCKDGGIKAGEASRLNKLVRKVSHVFGNIGTNGVSCREEDEGQDQSHPRQPYSSSPLRAVAAGQLIQPPDLSHPDHSL